MANGLFGGGIGTYKNPYLVEDAHDLNAIRNNMTAHYKQTKVIDMTGYPEWIPIGKIGTRGNHYFKGRYNGQGFQINNLSINESTRYGALFYGGEQATFENIRLNNISINVDDDYAAGLCIYAEETSITNCHILSGTITANGDSVGGLLIDAEIETKISQCTVNADLSGGDYIGGVVSQVYDNSKLSRCSYNGTISGGENVGGIASTIEYGNCLVDQCTSKGRLVGYENVGGLVGRCWGEDTVIQLSSSVMTIEGGYYVGGLCGILADSTVTNSFYSGNIKGAVVGGLVGECDNSTIERCYMKGHVRSESTNVGGLVGYLYRNSIVKNSYSHGSVEGVNSVGGLVGYMAGASIINCYSIGGVMGLEDDVGGLVGELWAGYENELSNIINHSYYDTQTSNQSDSGKGEGKSTAMMKEKSSFKEWDFKTVWKIKERNSYPEFISKSSTNCTSFPLFRRMVRSFN